MTKKLPAGSRELPLELGEVSSDEPVLIGVSGGRDSVALLHTLVERGARDLIVCHLDHGLRAASREDARFVQRLAEKFDLPCAAGRRDVRALARRRKQSLETAAREARYEFFGRVAEKRGCPRVLLAHHADDQVETFLFNLLRGAGVGGLAAMRAEGVRVVKGVELRLIRPLLGVWREEIDAYVARHGIKFREDASNADPRHTRNRLRHELLPAMETIFGRDVRRAIWRAANLCAAEDDWVRALVPEPSAELATRELLAMPEALQRRLIHRWLKSRGVPDVGFDDVENVRALLAGRGAKVNLPSGCHARRRAGLLFLE